MTSALVVRDVDIKTGLMTFVTAHLSAVRKAQVVNFDAWRCRIDRDDLVESPDQRADGSWCAPRARGVDEPIGGMAWQLYAAETRRCLKSCSPRPASLPSSGADEAARASELRCRSAGATIASRMSARRLGVWQSVHPMDASVWFSLLGVPWWIAGGWAIDLHLGRETRAHADLDVGVLRRDVAAVRERFAAWEMFESKDGMLSALEPGQCPRLEVNSLWCRPVGATLWTFELMLDDSVDDAWIYRRQPSIRRPL